MLHSNRVCYNSGANAALWVTDSLNIGLKRARSEGMRGGDGWTPQVFFGGGGCWTRLIPPIDCEDRQDPEIIHDMALNERVEGESSRPSCVFADSRFHVAYQYWALWKLKPRWVHMVDFYDAECYSVLLAFVQHCWGIMTVCRLHDEHDAVYEFMYKSFQMNLSCSSGRLDRYYWSCYITTLASWEMWLFGARHTAQDL